MGADTSVLATGGSAGIDAESRDSDGAAEAGLADAETDLGVGDTALVGRAVVGCGVLLGRVELPTVISEFPLL